MFMRPQDRSSARNVVGCEITVLASDDQTGSYEITLRTGAEGMRPPPHSHPGDEAFSARYDVALHLCAVTVGELRRGVELLRHRGDTAQAERLEAWLALILREFHDNILDLDEAVAQVWGHLRAPHAENALDKQVAATALEHDLTLVTRNEKHFAATGVKVLNPFQ